MIFVRDFVETITRK